ncbi:MC030R [Molluscum contagiosum virus subtype 1]|uniref:MC030R n=3 Tax=Molluscum contagiosum virus TaxID=10279 RepID=Q98198_MCV1|nr:MC030R [Molluscum contagiosum virus subtype 1]AZT86338.1 MC030R [Molluscum contagiosum virus]AAC55158.1 MC030R [Molluscum contagiosum virus subtype 1]AQY16775.1 MC030 [Molluscum contagiosum virus subtype 1]AQY16954.1 MC030 [Molluscum contagiosum virus subtype 1]AQY17134.1 MC030 [Molluscum contagiosum virus subtype 1]
MILKEPFIVDTVQGRFLVLKYVKLCGVKTVECKGATASCVLKVEKPESPCERRSPSPPPSPGKCEPQVPFMRTNLLASMFSENKNNAAKMLA